MPPLIQEETRQRLFQLARAKGWNLEIRFQGQFCYIDAYEEDSEEPTHLCRLRYFGGEKKWSLAFYTYSHEKYEPCIYQTGEWLGTPEEGLEIGAGVYLS